MRVLHRTLRAGSWTRPTVDLTVGRVARSQAAADSRATFGGAFSEALRHDVLPQRRRVGVAEPGAVDTELAPCVRVGVREATARQVEGMGQTCPVDIAGAVADSATRDRRVVVSEVVVSEILVRASAITTPRPRSVSRRSCGRAARMSNAARTQQRGRPPCRCPRSAAAAS